MKVIRIQLEIDVAIHSDKSIGVSDEELRAQLERHLHDWSDGRHCFSTELLHDGLTRSVLSSIDRTIDNQIQSRYPQNQERLGKGPYVGNWLHKQRTNGLVVRVYGGKIAVPSVKEVVNE